MTIPAMKWCGVEHPHGPHHWVVPLGQTGTYASCPGSSGRKTVGACGVISPSPLEGTPPVHCDLEHGHRGAHEDGDGCVWFTTATWQACGRGICANRAGHPGRCSY